MDVKIVKLYTPVLIAISLILSTFFVENNNVQKEITLHFLGTIEYSIFLKNYIVTKSLLFLAALISLGCYLFFDFSALFPDRLKMKIFYDSFGIDNNLKNFSKKELDSIGIAKDYANLQSVYYEDIDTEIKKILNTPAFFTVLDGHIHSKGETVFTVKREKRIQKYIITEAKGQLEHILERPNSSEYKFITFFEKIPSSNDYLRPNFKDIYIKQKFILKPLFKQILAENYNSNRVYFHHILCGVTKVKFFPYPSFSNTVYFFKVNESFVPIGYAIYDET